jgi:hypothetical protein
MLWLSRELAGLDAAHRLTGAGMPNTYLRAASGDPLVEAW